jgi:SAM-dependent methyltransferase
MPNDYLLAQGAADVDRLALLNQVFGPPSEALLVRAGLKPGSSVAEIGCGSGNMTCWLAKAVGRLGKVTGVDASTDALDQVRKLAQANQLNNVDLVHGDVNRLSLPAQTFDLVYCRLVLMHQRQPEIGLGQMRALVRPGGALICEEMDLSRCFFDPPAPFVQRLMELNVALGDRQGVHYRLGSRLNTLFRKIGCEPVEVSFVSPAALRGPTKRLLSLSFRSIEDKVVSAGLATQAELDEILREAACTDADSTTLYGLPLMGQAWARIA